MDQIPPQLPSRDTQSDEERFPLWLAITLAVVLAGALFFLTVFEVRDKFPDEPGRALAYLIGAMLVLPIISLVISVVAKPLRSVKGFCIVFILLSLISILPKVI